MQQEQIKKWAILFSEIEPKLQDAKSGRTYGPDQIHRERTMIRKYQYLGILRNYNKFQVLQFILQRLIEQTNIA